MSEFNLNKAPLEGTNLIEAAAGTGKTYNIAGLFVRLILEKHLQANEILVVTFTKAATEELKDRIRLKIQETIRAFETGRSDDQTLEELTKNYAGRDDGIRRLKAAVREFDEAAIYTIHSFCQKMLHDNAFESGSLFNTELLPDQTRLLMQVVDDFWGKYFHNASPLFLDYLAANASEKIDSPEKLFALLETYTRRLSLQVIPQMGIPAINEIEKNYKNSVDNAKSQWPSVSDEVAGLLLTDDVLNKKSYNEKAVRDLLAAMDFFMSSTDYSATLFKGFEKFGSTAIKKATRKNMPSPYHPFFETCEELIQKHDLLSKTYECYLLALKTKLLNYARHELKHLKQQKNIFSYDDLLTKMLTALQGPGGQYLAQSVRLRFKAALIDEFQDTDPVQYEIFKIIYCSPDRLLFLIGDPKQAIYSFRGADIFAYMKAIKQVDNRYTLSKNWRSEENLIKAINAIFGKARNPFIYDEIPFIRAQAAQTAGGDRLSIDNRAEPPCQLWFFDTRAFGDADLTAGKIKKESATAAIAQAVANEIAGLLKLAAINKIMLGAKRLGAGDIAVLVRKNKEARVIQNALSPLNIPSVLYSTENVFDSPEAIEIERLLAAFLDPYDDNSIKAALTTDLIGIPGHELFALAADTKNWENWLTKFRDYHDLWNNDGFIRMFRIFLIREKIRSRLLKYPNGERRMTNVLHLGELLHQETVSAKLGMAGLVKWLVNRRMQEYERLEEHQLRLESDENAVKIVTIHKSKGLQYDITFCPFTWDASRLGSRQLNIFHNKYSDYDLTLDLGSDDYDNNKAQTEIENLAENLRLLYVALTRAKYRTYLAWGLFNKAGTSAPAYLFHQPPESKQENALDSTQAAFDSLTDDEVLAGLQEFQADAGDSFEITTMPSPPTESYTPPIAETTDLQCRKFSAQIDYSWRISSFSQLTSGKSIAIDLPDYDSAEYPEQTPVAAGDMAETIFTFPKGAKAGTFFHDIFEHLDFTISDEKGLDELINQKLKAYGYESVWIKIIAESIKNILTVPLKSSDREFSLSQITPAQRLSELEFYFPLKTTTPEKLVRLFNKYSVEPAKFDFHTRIEKLQFSTVKGFMKGYIDLVFQYQGQFYIIDWKSNHLGNDLKDYDRDKLQRSMTDNFYTLQYIIYCAALHQYLSARLPGYDYDRHFGGVFYLYLRGMNPRLGDNYSVFYDRPQKSFMEELIKELIG